MLIRPKQYYLIYVQNEKFETVQQWISHAETLDQAIQKVREQLPGDTSRISVVGHILNEEVFQIWGKT